MMNEGKLLALLRQVVREELGAQAPLALKMADAAKHLAVSEQTVRRMIRRGELLMVMVSNKPRVPVSEVQRLLTPRRSPAMPEHGQKPVPAKVRTAIRGKAMKRKATSAEAAAARALLRQR
jgi:excisionase family DNA binding protein